MINGFQHQLWNRFSAKTGQRDVEMGKPGKPMELSEINYLQCFKMPLRAISQYVSWVMEHQKKSLPHLTTFFLVYLMRGLQTYAFWATITCKIKQAGSFCHFSFFTIQKAIVSCIFLQFSHQVDMKIIANICKYFLWYSIHLVKVQLFWEGHKKQMSKT